MKRLDHDIQPGSVRKVQRNHSDAISSFEQHPSSGDLEKVLAFFQVCDHGLMVEIRMDPTRISGKF